MEDCGNLTAHAIIRRGQSNLSPTWKIMLEHEEIGKFYIFPHFFPQISQYTRGLHIYVECGTFYRAYGVPMYGKTRVLKYHVTVPLIFIADSKFVYILRHFFLTQLTTAFPSFLITTRCVTSFSRLVILCFDGLTFTFSYSM